MAKCGKPCEVFSRVVGYHRNIGSWNKGKQAEFKDRVEFNQETSEHSRFAKAGHPLNAIEKAAQH